jgi:protein ImuA
MHTHKLSLLRSALMKPSLPAEKRFIKFGHVPVDQALRGGLRRGALHEVFACAGHEAAATGFVVGLAARLAEEKQILWIGEKFVWQEHGMPYPKGVFEFGLNPSQIMFLSVAHAQDALRAAGDALTCASLGIVIIEIIGNPKILDLTTSRRLVLACAQNSVPAILLRFGAGVQNSAAETRWTIKAAPSAIATDQWGHPTFDASLIRNRNGQTGQWVFAWSCDDGNFESAKAAFGLVVSAPANRPAEAA